MEASSKTVRNRTSKVCTFRSTISGDSGTQRQLVDEMKALPPGEREELMAIFANPVTISAENALALKADLLIPWKKLRAMRRYIITLGIQ